MALFTNTAHTRLRLNISGAVDKTHLQIQGHVLKFHPAYRTAAYGIQPAERWVNGMRFKRVVHADTLVILMACMLATAPAAVQAQPDNPSPPAEPGGAPSVFFQSRQHDFGSVQPDAPLTHDFIFKNQGAAALLIKNVKAG